MYYKHITYILISYSYKGCIHLNVSWEKYTNRSIPYINLYYIPS